MIPLPSQTENMQHLNARASILRDHRRRLVEELRQVDQDLASIAEKMAKLTSSGQVGDKVSL